MRNKLIAVLFILFTLLSGKLYGFCIVELKADFGLLGTSRYIYSGHELNPYTMTANWGGDFHFIYPLKKNEPDHLGFGFGVTSYTFWSSYIYNGQYLSEHKYLSMYTYWLKIPLVFTYSIIDTPTYMNFDIGVYYGIPLSATRSLELADVSIDVSDDKIPADSMNSDFGLHFQWTIGFGMDYYVTKGHVYPAITGLGAGLFLDISLSDQLNLPGEDFSCWSLGIIVSWPFFLQI